MQAKINDTINKVDSTTTDLLTSLIEKTKEKGKKLTNESIELALELTDTIGSKLLDGYKENSLLNKWKKYKGNKETAENAKIQKKKDMESALDTRDMSLENHVRYEKSKDLSAWANDLKFEIDKIMKGHPYGFAGEREAKRGLKLFEELLEASSIGPVKNKPLLELIKTCKSLIAVYTDRLSSNDKEINDDSTSIDDKITLMNTFDFTDQFERAVNRAITDICYSSPICGDRDKLSRVEKEIVSLLFSCLRKEYPTAGMAKTNSCFYEYSKFRDIIASEKEKDSSDYDDSEHEKIVPIDATLCHNASFFALAISYLYKSYFDGDKRNSITDEQHEIQKISKRYISHLGEPGDHNLELNIDNYKNIKDISANFNSDLKSFTKLEDRIFSEKKKQKDKLDNIEDIKTVRNELLRMRSGISLDDETACLSLFKNFFGTTIKGFKNIPETSNSLQEFASKLYKKVQENK